MAQGRIRRTPINTVGLSPRDQFAMEMAVSAGLRLPFFDMADIYTEAMLEVDHHFESQSISGTLIDLLPDSFSFHRVGNITPSTAAVEMRDPSGKTLGIYLARKLETRIVLVGEGLASLISKNGFVKNLYLGDLPTPAGGILEDL